MKIKKLDWNEQNLSHIDLHGISANEVAEVCYGKHISRKNRGRFLIYGQTKVGRYLIVVLEKHGSRFIPITARDMTNNEKRAYKRMVK